MTRRPLPHDADERKLNQQTQEHPRDRNGMRVVRLGGGLGELRPPQDLDPKDPQDVEKSRANPDLQTVLRDSVSVVDKKGYDLSVLARSRMLVTRLLFCLSREGWRSLLLQRRLRLLHHAILESKLHFNSWPADVAPLIRRHHLMDPWKPAELLQVQYTAPADGAGGLSRAHLLAEYVREGKRKFALYADGHQETRRLRARVKPTTG